MNDRFLEDRRQEHRLHRFTLGAALAGALAVHAALVLAPAFRYRPVLEQAKLRPVVVARRRAEAGVAGVRQQASPIAASKTAEPPAPPRPAERPPPPPPSRGAPPGDVPPPSSQPAPAGDTVSAARTLAGAGQPMVQPSASSAPAAPPADLARQGAGPAPARPAPPAAPSGTLGLATRGQGTGRDDWSALLSDLATRKKSLEAKQAEAERDLQAKGAAVAAAERQGSSRASGRGSGRGGGGDGSDPEGYVDSRIRTKVTSYPPTAIEESYPAIPYPDLRIHRRDLEKGICRVYYRVWVDERGEVARTQLKAPETSAAQKRYAPFVEAVTRAVAKWPFPRTAAEVHIDVLFEIE